MDWRGCRHCVDIWTGGAVVTVWTGVCLLGDNYYTVMGSLTQ